MTFKPLFTVLFSLLATGFLLAQPNVGPAGMHAQVNIDMMTGPMFGTIRPFDGRYKGFKGHPTVYEEFVPGKVRMIDGKLYENALFNYDAFNNEVYYRYQSNRQVVVVDISKIEKLFLYQTEDDERAFVPVNVKEKDLGLMMMELLVEGNGQMLVKRHKKVLVKAAYQEAYSAGKEHDEFRDRTEYYFVKGKESQKINPNSKGLMKLFPEKAEMIEKTIKKEKLDLKSEDDLKKLMSLILSA